VYVAHLAAVEFVWIVFNSHSF